MRVNKNFTLTVPVARELEREDNASGKIERLLRDHYSMEILEEYEAQLEADAEAD